MYTQNLAYGFDVNKRFIHFLLNNKTMRKYENVITPESIKLLTIDSKYNLPIMSTIGRNNGLGDFKFISDSRKIALSAYDYVQYAVSPLVVNFQQYLEQKMKAEMKIFVIQIQLFQLRLQHM